MAIVLFALIGAKMNFGVAYWICFAVFCVAKVLKAIDEVLKNN